MDSTNTIVSISPDLKDTYAKSPKKKRKFKVLEQIIIKPNNSK